MFSKNLQKARSSKGISQEKFAEMLEVSRQTVSAWENGQSSPDFEKAVEISKILNISLDEIAGLKSNQEIIKEEKMAKSKRNQTIDRIGGIIMAVATIGYILFGLFTGSLTIWQVFPIAAMIAVFLSLFKTPNENA